jgi:hypothetical protein
MRGWLGDGIENGEGQRDARCWDDLPVVLTAQPDLVHAVHAELRATRAGVHVQREEGALHVRVGLEYAADLLPVHLKTTIARAICQYIAPGARASYMKHAS